MNNAVALASMLSIALVGCLVPEGPDIDDALPTAESVQVKVPEGETDPGASNVVGDIADYYRFTRNVSREFNGGAAFVLTLVHVIVQYPPTEVDGNVYTWGPHSDALDPAEWMLVVTENGDGSYDYRFDGRSKTVSDAEFVTIINGKATPGAERFRGHGGFTIDFDAAEEVDPIDNDAQGAVDVEYDLRGSGDVRGDISMHIEGRQPGASGEIVDVSADYAYSENNDGSGDFSFGIHADLNDNASLFEDGLIRSRWQNDGAGRGDAMLSGGDLGGLTVTASECWNTQFRRVYYGDSLEATEGSSDDCVFGDMLLPSN